MVTHDPPPGLAGRVREMACGDLVIVDNGSAEPPGPDEFDGEVELLRNDHNRGIAAALNQGVARAAARGARYALLLDHDSVLAPGARQTLTSTLARHPDAVACVPGIRYSHPDIRCRWPQTPPGGRFRFRFVYADRMRAAQPVDLAISSGMLVDIEKFRQLGGFDERLFIDLVDTEFCLLARRHGLRILAEPAAELQHALGRPSKHLLLGRIPVFPTHHSAFRHYHLARNRVILSRRYGWRFPSWLAYEWLGAAKLTLKVLLYEPGRWTKLWAMLRGTAAGITWRSEAKRS